MFLLYRPSRDTTVSSPLRNFNVGRCSIRSNATYFEPPSSEGPRMPQAIDRPTCRPNSPGQVELNHGNLAVQRSIIDQGAGQQGDVSGSK